MKYRSKSIIFWIFTVIFTIVIAIYQRMTGPTYPETGKIEVAGQTLKYRLLTSHGGDTDAVSKIFASDTSVKGSYQYKRFKVDEPWTKLEMMREGDYLLIILPHQPPAGKLVYTISLERKDQEIKIHDEPITIRFKGGVPDYILYPHILMMFLAMVFSTRTGLEVLIKGRNTFNYTLVTIILLFFGGLILGPVMQLYAFGDLWTGWPFGQDLTDNKTLVAFIFWLIALIRIWRNREHRGWALVAAIVMLIIYFIPHSVLGSELDYSTGEVVTGQ
jgi:hypothetical protein